MESTAAAVGLLSAVIVVARVAAGGGLNVLYGEDGTIFLEQALHDGPAAFARTYNGYLHLLPRVAAWAATAVPSSLYGIAILTAAASCVGAIAAVVFLVARERLPEPHAAAAALVMPLVPAAAWAAIGTVAHLQWWLIYACMWLAVTRTSRFGPVVAVTAMSSPLGLLIGPLMWRHWRWWVPGAAVQGAALMASGRLDGQSNDTWIYDGAVHLATTVAAGPVAAGTLGLAVTTAAGWIIWRSRRPTAWALAGAAVAFYAVSIVANGAHQPRYEVLPQMLVWAAVVVATVELPRRWQRGFVAAGVLLALLAFPASSDNRTAGHATGECPVLSAPAGWDPDCTPDP